MLDFAKIASEIKDAPAVEREKNKVLSFVQRVKKRLQYFVQKVKDYL